MPFLYFLTGVVNRLFRWGDGAWRRYTGRNAGRPPRQFLRTPGRLLLLALTIRWLLSTVTLPFLARQFWSTIATVIAVIAGIWLLILLTNWGERYLVGRGRGLIGSASVLRLVSRMIDGLLIFTGVLLALFYFNVD